MQKVNRALAYLRLWSRCRTAMLNYCQSDTSKLSFPTISEVTISTIFDVFFCKGGQFRTREIGLAKKTLVIDSTEIRRDLRITSKNHARYFAKSHKFSLA
jgi:hypothetical protein